jgi:hypothetical protein
MRGHSAIASTAFAITAMSPSAPGTSTSGSVAGSALKFISATAVVNMAGYACGTHGSRMTSTVYASLRCCTIPSSVALPTLFELSHQHRSSHRNGTKPRLASQLLDTTMLITFDWDVSHISSTFTSDRTRWDRKGSMPKLPQC